MTHCQFLPRILSLMPICLLSFGVQAANLAGSQKEAESLFNSGKYTEALNKTDEILLKDPHKAQARFLKGLILVQQKKEREAIALFSQLTIDFPNLPEPYNNIAVLQAATGQYEAARVTLEKAIQINPQYTTAHENLGDLYAKLAAQQYDKVLQLNTRHAPARNKLKIAASLVSVATKESGVKGAGQDDMQASSSIASTTYLPDKSGQNSNEVLATINSWAAAWSAKDIDKYLGFYSETLAYSKGQSRQDWVEERRSRINAKAHINVKIESPQVKWEGNTAKVSFRQIYISDRLKDTMRKTLVMERQDGQWRITRESAG